MPTKDDLNSEILDLQALLTKWSSKPAVLVLPKRWFNDLACRLFEQSVDLEASIEKTDPASDAFAELRKKVFDFDLDVRRAVAGRIWLLAGSTLAVVAVAGAALYALLYSLGVVGLLWSSAQLAMGAQFILLALAGAFIHLVTAPPPGQATVSLTNLSLGKGIFIAIVVPIVLIVLFSDGKTFNLRQEGQLLSFACGYSAKLALDVLNKLVDKASTIINSI